MIALSYAPAIPSAKLSSSKLKRDSRMLLRFHSWVKANIPQRQVSICPMPNILLMAAGIFFLVLGLLMLIASGAGDKGEVKGGGIILIGPIPIVFGGSSLKLLIAFLIIFMVIIVLLMSLSIRVVA